MNKSESEKLTAYNDALSKLEPETQLRKMRAVKSEDTIRRFLSEDAPSRLVHRFSTKINGTIARDLSFFEKGRIAFINYNFSFAREQLMRALQDGDERAHYYLGKLNVMDSDIFSAKENYLHSAKIGYQKTESLIEVAKIALHQHDTKYAIEVLMNLFNGNDKPTRDYCSLRIAQLLNIPIDVNQGLLNLAAIDNEQACIDLWDEYLEDNNLEGLMMIGNTLTGMGYTELYQHMADACMKNDDINNAVKYHILAIKAGHESSYPFLIKILDDANRTDEAIEFCKEALGKGHRTAYFPLLTFLRKKNRTAEVLQYMSHALYNGFDEVHSLLDLIDTNDTVKNIFARETQTALMRGENLHPIIIERFLRIKMETPPSGPLN